MTALVVLPGLDGTATLHTDFVEAVRPAFESVSVLAYPPDRSLGYDQLEALARPQLPTAQPFVLLGESFSGPIAISIAAKPPPGLIGLVLSTTFAKSPIPLGRFLAPVAHLMPVRAIPARLMAWWLLGRWATTPVEVALKHALASVSPAVVRNRAASAIRVDVTSCLAHVSVPVLYLRATNDRLLSPTAVHSITATLPSTVVVHIPGPHLLLQASPAESARAIAAFAAGLR